MNGRQLLWVLFLTVVSLLFIWTSVLKVISRLVDRFGWSGPCPASLAWLVDNPIRRRAMRPVYDWVGFQPGERVLELGPGPGAFSLEAARRLGPQGCLLAMDIQPEMIALLDRRLRRARCRTIQTAVADACRLPLADHTLDRTFLVSVLPEIPDQDQALAELRRVLKPGGIVSITSEFLDPDYRFVSEVIHQVRQAGFQLEERFGNLWRYTVNFRVPAAGC